MIDVITGCENSILTDLHKLSFYGSGGWNMGRRKPPRVYHGCRAAVGSVVRSRMKQEFVLIYFLCMHVCIRRTRPAASKRSPNLIHVHLCCSSDTRPSQARKARVFSLLFCVAKPPAHYGVRADFHLLHHVCLFAV